jgi:hypothetical protein
VTYIHARKDTLGVAKFRSWCGCIITAPNCAVDRRKVTCPRCLRQCLRNAVSDIARSIAEYDDATPAKKAALTRLRKRASAEYRARER